MKIIAIVQARMGSTRLPGKVLRDIHGETMLSHVVQRTKQATALEKVVVATTVGAKDDVIVAECQRLNVAVFRGSEADVLDRYYQAALTYQADAIVRITADCPLIDPSIIDHVAQAFLQQKPDYASNVHVRTYPRGLDIEIMTQDALFTAWRKATETYQRNHVTPYIYQNPQQFHLISVMATDNFSQYRWTVDTIEDLQFVQAVYAELAAQPQFNWLDVVQLLEQQPSLQQLNQHIEQKKLEAG